MKKNRNTPIGMGKREFRKSGYQLIDQIAHFIDSIREQPVTTGESPGALQQILGNELLPEEGSPANEILSRAASLLFNHSLYNGHPKFFGYITSSPAPIGALGDLLAATVNPNAGANILSPMATEIEKQTIKWLASMIGYSTPCGGILVSGGNMANFTAFLAARTAKGPKTIKEEGIANDSQKMLVYCSTTTHTWIDKAAVLFGLGTRSIRWIGTAGDQKMNNQLLEQTIMEDLEKGYHPLMVIGTAGDVSTGVVDDLEGIAMICKKYDLWFHIDGAYGIPAAVVPELQPLFSGIEQADSIALDPHKWLYAPLEAGCTLVKDPNHLTATFSSHPVYYNFSHDEEPETLNFYEYGFQNSRGFRALKVWLSLQQAGRKGYIEMIREDIQLAGLLYKLARKHHELEAVTNHLSITTFRFVPAGSSERKNREAYLNKLNEALLNELQKGGELFLSNAVVNGKYCLRACIVNFRTSKKDIEEVIDIVVRNGHRVSETLLKEKSS
ncbi:MAG: aspartate aminotransferase family protein [Terrimonas sp.]|nr:aspartate aminotransferase family protein [Terrimonas sp.]